MTAVACRLLEADPDLGCDLAAERRRLARERLVARVATLREGRHGPPGAAFVQQDPASRGAGLLVLDGLLLRRVGISGHHGTELLGAGDLLRPWQGEDDEPVLAAEAAWHALERCHVAVLDAGFMSRAAEFPEVAGRLVERALSRSRRLVSLMAIAHQRRLDVRLHMLLWHLAGRWGRVVPGGVRLSLPISHGTLAELAAARRPSVTTALGRLADSGAVLVDDGGWLLVGGPPIELTLIEGPSPRVLSSHAAARDDGDAARVPAPPVVDGA